MSTNIEGFVFITQLAVKQMLEQGTGGRVITITAALADNPIAGEPERYWKDVPKAEVHVLEAGHFALDTKADEVAVLIRRFMNANTNAKNREVSDSK